jgi:cell division protease FtsH
VDLPDRSARVRYAQRRRAESAHGSLSDACVALLADKSTGMSLAGLEQVFEQAVRAAIRSGTALTDEILLEALDAAREGDRKSWSPDLLESTARHEAGHALLYWASGWWSPEVSIVARADYGGGMRRCEEDLARERRTRGELLATIRTMLGGRAAEIIYYGPDAGLTTGASGDLDSASRLARQMICRYGMSAEFGLLAVPELLQDARGVGSPAFERVNELASRILAGEMQGALAVLNEHRAHLDAVSAALVSTNRLYRRDLEALLPPCPGVGRE